MCLKKYSFHLLNLREKLFSRRFSRSGRFLIRENFILIAIGSDKNYDPRKKSNAMLVSF